MGKDDHRDFKDGVVRELTRFQKWLGEDIEPRLRSVEKKVFVMWLLWAGIWTLAGIGLSALIP